MFIVLRAFASGGAAVTGVEAISNGVPAFRKPEWKNARTTLVMMGVILCTSFLVVSYLAHRLRVIPVADESKSLLGQIGQAVYGTSAGGQALFYVLQISTTLILILAANTSFADFPRLASFHAHDAFMPRQLTKRGHKLVFSNGIVALAGAASLVIVVFQASVTAMIPLYALGVFTSFTLSQSGMAKRHLRLRERGWRTGLLMNGLGAVTTLVVTIIIAIVKFKPKGELGGAWMVILFVPIMVAILVRVNKTYEAEEADLLEGLEHVDRTKRRRHRVVVVANSLDQKTIHAVQYAMTVGPEDIWAVHFDTDRATTEALRRAWAESGVRFPLDVQPCPGDDLGSCLKDYVLTRCTDDIETTLIVPGPARLPFWRRLVRGRTWTHLMEPLRKIDTVNLAVIREHPGHDGRTRPRISLSPRRRHIVLILVGRLDRSVLKALRYARAVDATDIRALHAAVDVERAEELLEQWSDAGTALEAPLDLVECPDRNIARTVTEEVARLAAPDTEVTVVLPRRDYPHWTQRLLHDQTSRAIRRALVSEAHVDVVTVPYRVSNGGGPWTTRLRSAAGPGHGVGGRASR